MRFTELIKRVEERGVKVVEMRLAGDREGVPTPWSDGSGGANVDPDIRGVSEDSRKVKPGDLFVARAGTRTDGARYVEDALHRGAVALVGEMVPDQQGVAWAQVTDANMACAILAHEVAGNPTAGMKMIGITGTKGKTTVAYLLRSVLKMAGWRVGMIGTVEVDDGGSGGGVPAEMTTPGSVELVELLARMKANRVTHCVMEVSSHSLDQQRVAGIDFDVAVFTNLTGDHLDYHRTTEAYAAAKARLFEGLKEGAVAVVNADDKWAAKMVQGCPARIVECRVGGFAPRGGWVTEILEMTSAGMKLGIAAGQSVDTTGGPQRSEDPTQTRICIRTELVGRHNASNIICTIGAMASLGLIKRIFDIGLAKGAPGRLQRVSSRKESPFSVFVDYAHTHDALENVLTALRATMNGGRLICVFGCGGDRDRIKRPKMGAVAQRLADRVIVTSDNPRTEKPEAIIEEICRGFSPGWRDAGVICVQPDRRAAIRQAIGQARDGDVVLIAGKGHENYQIIGTMKHHFDDVEEALAALRELEKQPRPLQCRG